LIGRGVARRYATALFKVGVEDGQAEKYAEELKAFNDFLESDKEIKFYLVTPLVERTLQQQVLNTILEKMVFSEIMQRFLLLLFEKKRLKFVPDILEYYNQLLDGYRGICRAKLLSAVPLTEDVMEKIKERLKAVTGKKEVILEVEERPELIGGIITKIGDVIYDGSVRTQLNILKENIRRGEV